ncbi:MAG: alpha/beta hydrolase family protein [Parcubacteria group bacterium]
MRKFWIALAGLTASIWASAARAEGPPPLKAYGELPGFETAALSPSGERYAVVGTLGEQRKIALVSTADDKPLMIGDVGDSKIWNLEWAGEDKVVVHGSGTYALGPIFNVPKFEIGHAVVLSLSSRAAKPLLAKGAAGNGIWGTYGVVQEGGRWYGYFGGVTLARSAMGDQYYWDKGQPDLYRVDLDTGSAAIAASGVKGEGLERDWVVGPDGVVATLDYNNRSGDWQIRAGKTGAQLASGKDPLGDVALLGRGRTADTVLYKVPGAHEEPHWMEQPLSGAPAVEILADEDAADLIFDRRTKLLIGYLRGSDRPEPVFFDSGLQAKVDAALKPFAALNSTLESWDDAFERMIVHTSGVGDSGSWWLVDLRSGKARQIGYSYPAVRPQWVGPMKTISWKAADGLAMEGVLTLPPNLAPKNLPLVVLPHGGPAARDYPDFDWWAQAFASGGYAVFQPNFRGSTGYGDDFQHAGDGEWGAKMQTDISDGVAELARQGIVDPKRTCIVGASYGGYAALAGVTIQQGLYRCAVSVAGVSDLPTFTDYVRDKSAQSPAARRSWLQEIGPNRDQKAFSPARLADRADAPILLIHGKDDTVVPYEQSVRMREALEGAHKPVEMVTLKGGDHWLSRGETRLQMLEAAEAFVEKYNPAD